MCALFHHSLVDVLLLPSLVFSKRERLRTEKIDANVKHELASKTLAGSVIDFLHAKNSLIA